MDTSLNVLKNSTTSNRRTGLQPLMPAQANGNKPNGYDIYPTHALASGKIFNGYASLAAWIVEQKFVALDGYVGVFWDDVRHGLEDEFDRTGTKVTWINAADSLKPVAEVQEMVNPYIGQPNTVWGTKAQLKLADFFNFEAPFTAGDQVTIAYGVGSSLNAPGAHLAYFDLPKNELQLRMRAKAITNIGNDSTDANAEMYKRYYFVDWVVLNQYKQQILDKIEVIADAQWMDTINWMHGADFRAGLQHLGKGAFRVRPWFEAGAWGGQWMKDRIEGLNKDEINLAWSFELIVPENGLVFESDRNLLEVSFDFLMFNQYQNVLGDHAERFGYEFPIRFDFLDTWQGGNLSIQCHPSKKYIQKNFGETITQDETYYILDCEKDATVYLGFQDDIDPTEFRKELENSQEFGKEIEITKYVQSFTAEKHDLFLIPNGTVHSAGAGNLVLEISATPYIFTFKMYDWVRLGLDGEPRAINIDHAFKNLNFDRKGDKVQEELISKQTVTETGADWQIVHCPTHADHFYDVERLEFDSSVEVQTNGSVQVLMLVEGSTVTVETADGEKTTFSYAETFVIPAAAKSFKLTNNGSTRAKVVKAFLKA